MNHSKLIFAFIFSTSIVYAAILGTTACTRSTGASTDATASDSTYSDEYHADNDIAMTLRSITDALRVGEPLDTIDYNYEGVLTDGEGRPLYTDIQGSPGMWDIDVLSPTAIEIRNIYLGDLFPEDLEHYIVTSLNLRSDNVVETKEKEDDEETQLVVYDFGGGYLRIETRASVAPNGLEGPMMTIVATSDTATGGR